MPRGAVEADPGSTEAASINDDGIVGLRQVFDYCGVCL